VAAVSTQWEVSLLPGADESPVAVAPSETSDAVVARPRFFGVLWWVVVLIIALDQATKLLVNALVPVYGSHTIIPNLIDLVHVHNAGVAFGLLNGSDHPQRSLITTSLALVALVGIAYYARHVRSEERLARVGLSLILGGAVGNLIDRMRQGYVIDFVDVYWGDWHFWAFNVADAAISVGATLVFADVLFFHRHASHPVSDR
jgi:signal peptidase II